MPNNLAIPVEFWKSLSDEEWNKVLMTSTIDRRLCRRLWALLGRVDKAPHQVSVFVNKDDLMRQFPAKSQTN